MILLKTRAKALFAGLKAVSGAGTPNSRQNVQRTNDEPGTRVDCNGAYRFPSDRPKQAFSTNPGERLKSNHIDTSDGTNRFNSAHRDCRGSTLSTGFIRSECV